MSSSRPQSQAGQRQSGWRRFFRRKSLELLLEEMAGDNRLHRVLGPVALTSLGVGAIIGAGIFVTTGLAAQRDAGPSIILSYTVAAIGCALAAFCYAEFASMAPVAGSAYTYSYTTLGELLAWIIGWDLILEYAMACATVAASWSGYLNELLNALGLPIVPHFLMNDPFATGADGAHAWFNLPAVFILAAVTVVLVVGIRESAATNTILVIVKLAVVLFVIAFGVSYINPDNWTKIPVESRTISANETEKWGLLGTLGINQWLTPIDDAVRSPFAPYGFSGIMLGAAIVFFAYIGFDSISTHAEEARNPKRDVPIAILISLGLCTVLYVGVSAVITGMVPYPQIDIKAPVAAAFSHQAEQHGSALLRGATALIALGGLAGMTSVLLVTFLSQSRIFLAMARDGLLPPIFGQVHPKFKTPHLSTMLTGGLMALVAAFTPIAKLAEMVNIGTLMAFVIVCGSVMLLRIQRPDAERPFRCPAIYLVAPGGILVNLTLMLFLPIDTWLRLVVWLAIGMSIYFFYSQRHSNLGKQLMLEIGEVGVTGQSDRPRDE
jgi:APA family basic amino acid/polyamine antiporter